VAILNGRPLKPPHEQDPRANLFVHGPLIVIQLSNPNADSQVLTENAADAKVVQPLILTGHALIDTGASHTSIDENAAQKLGLGATGSVPMMTPGGPRQASQYAVAWRISTTASFSTIGVMNAELEQQGLLMLLGRDILAGCILAYNGTSGTFSLSW
jgi:hypothetical protein